MIENIVRRAKKLSIKRAIAGGERGIGADDLLDSIKQEFREHEDLPNTTNPDDWAKISGKKGERIVYVRTIVNEGQSRQGRPADRTGHHGSVPVVDASFMRRNNCPGAREPAGRLTNVAVPKIVGIETEYGVALRGAPGPEPGRRVEPADQRLRRAAPRRLGLRGRVARPRRARLRPRRFAAARGRDASRQRGAHERRALLRRPRAPRVLHARVQRPDAGGAVRQGGGAHPRPLDGRGTPAAARGPGDRRLQEQQRRQGQLVRLPRELSSSTATCRSRCWCAT